VRDEPPRALDFCSLAALCDASFPRIFVTRASWVPFGTVSFTVHFHCNAATLPAIGAHHLLANARAHPFRNGCFDQAAGPWGPGGERLAVTHPIVCCKQQGSGREHSRGAAPGCAGTVTGGSPRPPALLESGEGRRGREVTSSAAHGTALRRHP
jgi:hypothetical protein